MVTAGKPSSILLSSSLVKINTWTKGKAGEGRPSKEPHWPRGLGGANLLLGAGLCHLLTSERPQWTAGQLEHVDVFSLVLSRGHLA